MGDFTSDFAKKCDEAIESRNINNLKILYENAIKIAENVDNKFIIRSNFYYFAYNCYGTIGVGNNDFQEKSLSLIRQAIICFEESNNDEENNNLLKYYQALKISIGNELDKSGRIISAIGNYYDVFDESSKDVTINLIISLIRYLKLLKNSDYIHFFYKKILDLMDSFYEKDKSFQGIEGLSSFYKTIKNKREHLESVTLKRLNISENTKSFNYRSWIARNKLAINPLNDIFTDLNVSLDSLYIDSVICKKDESNEVRELFLIYNEIKQEYASARYQLYEGISNDKYHFSDLGNNLKLDSEYILYSYGEQQIKNSYKAIYSIFSRIAYFLNKYNHVGILNKSLSLKRLFDNIEKNEMFKLQKFFCLNGLDWIKKDLYISNTNNDYKYSVDPNMEQIRILRNYLEHRLVKVVFYSNKFKVTDDTMVISFNILVNKSMYLLKKCRESIILLTLYINQNEDEKKRKRNIGDIPPLFLMDYPEDFKVNY